MKTIALVGTPNSGKTTLYNWLTGSHFKTVNYPGATVDYSCGESLEQYGEVLEVIDTPGTYSLEPKSQEEEVTLKVLFDSEFKQKPDLIVAVIDGTQFIRQAALAKQLIDSGYPVVVAITMEDLLTADKFSINPQVLEKKWKVPVVLINGQLGGGVQELYTKVLEATKLNSHSPTQIKKSKMWSTQDYSDFYSKYEPLKQQLILKPRDIKLTAKENTDKIDRFLLHPVGGLLFFMLIMTGLFTSIFILAAPFMDFIDTWIAQLANYTYNLAPNSLFIDFVSNGVIAGFGALFVFVPQIFILFFGLKLLEDTGYLARAATLVDKPLTKLGLNGRAFVPILSGYACAVPAMMAARNISNQKERWLTLFILPLMTCSARLPVYALLLGFLFYQKSAVLTGLALTGLYFLSFFLGGVAASVASRFLKNTGHSFLIMELPLYRRPKISTVIKSSFDKTWSFLTRAGPIIFVLSIVIWFGTNFPNYQLKDNVEKFNTSYATQLGQTIEPIMKPMGLDWKAGVGIIASFAAREVFVSAMAMIYNVAGDDDESIQGSLIKAMQESKHPDGKPVFNFASIIALLLFYAIALQCLATVAIARKESGSWKFAIMQLVVFNLLAYLVAVVSYQLLA